MVHGRPGKPGARESPDRGEVGGRDAPASPGTARGEITEADRPFASPRSVGRRRLERVSASPDPGCEEVYPFSCT